MFTGVMRDMSDRLRTEEQLEHERVFKFWIRNAGAPWWSSALTPKKGADTLSPFVVIAA